MKQTNLYQSRSNNINGKASIASSLQTSKPHHPNRAEHQAIALSAAIRSKSLPSAQ
jgi:hypothetical protein